MESDTGVERPIGSRFEVAADANLSRRAGPGVTAGFSELSFARRCGGRNETIPRESCSWRENSLRDDCSPVHGIRKARRLIRLGPDEAHPEAAHSPSPSSSSGPTHRFIRQSNTRGNNRNANGTRTDEP